MNGDKQLVRLFTKLAKIAQNKGLDFERKFNCINALSQLKYEAEQGRYDYWNTVPKINYVLSSFINLKNTKNFNNLLSELLDSKTLFISKSSLLRKQTFILAALINYSKYLITQLDKELSSLDKKQYQRTELIKTASLLHKEIETKIGQTKDCLYLNYLIHVFDTTKGEKALSLLLNELKIKYPVVEQEIIKLKSIFNISFSSEININYLDLINLIYDTSKQSRELQENITNELLSLRRWLSYTLLENLESDFAILIEQTIVVKNIDRIWNEDYSEKDIVNNINQLIVLSEQEEKARLKLCEEIEYYLRTKKQKENISLFVNSKSDLLMKLHKNLFLLFMNSNNLLSLLAEFYSVDTKQFDLCIQEITPANKSSLKRIISSTALNAFSNIF